MRPNRGFALITCVVHYVIDPDKVEDFERFAQRWMGLVEQHGGTHQGLLPPGGGSG